MWLLLISILDITLQMIFLMMMISIDNVELYLFKGILYCESLICVPWVLNSHSFVLIVHLYIYSTTLVELPKKSTITKLQIAYHNIF